MKLLVLAQTPPPVHGQSAMVRILVDGLPARGLALHHVNFALSRDAADIGAWRPGKVLAVLAGCLRAIAGRFRHGCDTLYYVPAPPGKRGALWRDWVVMLLCRPFFPRLVLHWHAPGLGAWLATRPVPLELEVTRWLLGRADLSLVLAPSLRDDAARLHARRVAVVANGIADPGVPAVKETHPAPSTQVLFLGLCSEEKGLFDAADAVLAANRVQPSAPAPAFRLMAAGAFANAEARARFDRLAAAHPGQLKFVGPVGGEQKWRLFHTSDCLCLPTHYPAEGQPLVLLEALACDLPVIASRWRAIPETLPPVATLVPPQDVAALAAALLQVPQARPPVGALRAHFLAHFTVERHLDALAAALRGG